MKPDTAYLDKARQDAIAREAARESMTVSQWDTGMQRIFKGIMSRPLRHSMLRAAQARLEATGTFARPSRTRECGPISYRDKNPRKRRGPGGGGKRKDGPRR